MMGEATERRQLLQGKRNRANAEQKKKEREREASDEQRLKDHA